MQPTSFIISDCKGIEEHLFCSAPIEKLKSCDMMIELNEQFAPGVTARIQRIFSVTRSIESVVSSGEHFMPQLNLNASLPPEKMQRAQTKIRGKQTWLFCLRVTKRIEPYLFQRKPSPHFLNV